jgi:hypothetical protein
MVSYEAIKMCANEISDGLLHDLKFGKLPKIGIDEIRAAISKRVASAGYNDPDDLETLEKLTVRRVVEKV